MSRSLAKVTTPAKRAEVSRRPASRRPFWSTARPRPPATSAATGAGRDARAACAHRARRFLSRRRRPRGRRRSRPRRRAGDARRSRAHPGGDRRSADDHDQCRHALQYAAADAGARLADDAGAVRRASASRRPRASSIVHGLIEAAKRALRVRDQAISDPDRMTQPPERFLANTFLDERSRRHRPRQGRAVFAAAGHGRHHLDGRHRRVAGWSCPTSSRSIGSSAPAWCCRAPAC